jgi:hypothetical protein
MIGLIEVGVEREKEKQNPTEEEKKQSTWKNGPGFHAVRAWCIHAVSSFSTL